ncbi:N-acetyltransferase eso1 [Dimargaris verticillata]|uniref:N-acetyltransferase eso1 n=1 Tax=Dimargaris verticillata TaxID=2761393 RepID=A0A9W8E7X0_9FUNG|nr:N-acetyltransferase eso1 [Dimargaris verticillata]
MTAVKALRPPVASWDNLTTWLGVLCTELHHRLSDEWSQAQRWPKTMVIYYRRQDGPSRSKSHPFPAMTEAFAMSSEPLLQLACQVAALIDKSNGAPAQPVSQLLPCASIAVSLSNFHGGSGKITTVSSSNMLTQWMSNGCSAGSKPKSANTNQPALPKPAAPLPLSPVPNDPTSDPGWLVCDQCTKRDRQGHPIKVVRIAKVEWAEHQDYHLALDLYRQDLKTSQPPVSMQPVQATPVHPDVPTNRKPPTCPASKRRRTTKKTAKLAPLSDGPADKGQTRLVFRPV